MVWHLQKFIIELGDPWRSSQKVNDNGEKVTIEITLKTVKNLRNWEKCVEESGIVARGET